MKLRHLVPAPLLLVAVLACTPSVPSNPNTFIPTALFDPTTGVIPLPNSLAISPDLNPYILHPRNAQEELLGYFAAQGGFPPDQIVSLNFPLASLTVNGPNDVTVTPADFDKGTVVPCTGAQAPGNCNLLVIDALAPAAQQYPDLTYGYSAGYLSVTPLVKGTPTPTTWRPGATYFYALRGGSTGVKTKANVPLQPSSTTYLLVFGDAAAGDFNCPSTAPDCALNQLKLLKTMYQPVFAAIQNKGFPVDETIVLGSFTVAPATTWVIADPGTGVVPVPSDFMLDPTTNMVSAAAASAFGISALATLDGFSTTGMDIAQTSGPIKAASVRSSTGRGVYFYKLGATATTEVSTVYTEPPPVTFDPSTGKPCTPINAAGDFGPTCVSTIIGIQPALTIPTAGEPHVFPPLEEKTEYAVIITKGVTDPAGIPVSKTTLGQMLLFSHPLCTPSPACASSPGTAVSQVPGVSGPQSSLLEGMRLRLQPAVSKLATDHNVAAADIVMPYTFRTQSITADALALGAAPYAKLATGADAFPDAPVAAAAVTPAAMALKWGVPSALITAGISKFLEATVVTFDKLDPTTGAFNPSPTAGTAVPLPTILALPTGTPPAGGWPLVIFHHGLGRSRGDMLFIAQALAGNGMVVAALDAAKHGARAWCVKNTVTGVAMGCNTGATCDTTIFAQQQLDAPTGKPGLCTNNSLQLIPIGCDPTTTPGCWDGTGGTSLTSGSFVVSANLFRSRDTVRQDILDQAMLVRVLTTANGNEVLRTAAGLPSGTVIANAGKVYYVGQSWGAIEGTIDLASNPRVSRAVLNVGGATLIDILTTAPSFEPLYEGLLEQLHLVPGTPNYLLFLIGAKWIADPGDPANFGGHLIASPLPNLLVDPTGKTPMAAKAILGQGARCDATVPNPTSEFLYGLVGLAPLEPTASSAAPGMQWFMNSTGGTCPANGDVGPGALHGFLLDWNHPALAAAAQAEVVKYLLGAPVAATPIVVP